MPIFDPLVRAAIRKLKPYSSARSLAVSGRIFLDANESPERPFLGTTEWDADLNRYPLPQPPALLERFSRLYGVRPEQILIGRGSDEAIDVLTRVFCEPASDSILITPPTYGMYEVSADIQGAQVLRVPLAETATGWRLNLKATLAALDSSRSRVKLIYLCSPNNPTGGVIPREEVRALCEAVGERAVIVVDEAYGEFSPADTSIPLLADFSHLVVLRTLSKAWALAGLRCGVALGHPHLIELLQKVRAPYPLPQPVIQLVAEATAPEAEAVMRARVARLTAAREHLGERLGSLRGVERVFPSAANFLLARFTDPDGAMKAAQLAGVVIRRRDSDPALPGCLRITVGTAEENEALLNALGEQGNLR